MKIPESIITKTYGEMTFKDENLLSFLVDSVLDTKKSVYKSVKIIDQKQKNQQNEIILPSLILPEIPLMYLSQIKKYQLKQVKSERKLIPKQTNSPKNKFSHKQINPEIDGIPYNPKDFKFPMSKSEKEKLQNLAIELGLIKIRRKISTDRKYTMTKESIPLLKLLENNERQNSPIKRGRSMSIIKMQGNLQMDRIRLINNDLKYQDSLKNVISGKLANKRRKSKSLSIMKSMANDKCKTDKFDISPRNFPVDSVHQSIEKKRIFIIFAI